MSTVFTVSCLARSSFSIQRAGQFFLHGFCQTLSFLIRDHHVRSGLSQHPKAAILSEAVLSGYKSNRMNWLA